MLYNLILSLLFGYEIQKLFQFNFFFRLFSLSSDYKQRLLKRINSVAYQQLMKVSLVDLVYLITIVIGFFTKNLIFFSSIIIIMNIQLLTFKFTKNKRIRKIVYLIDIISSLILLGLIITNIFFYNLESIDFINKILA